MVAKTGKASGGPQVTTPAQSIVGALKVSVVMRKNAVLRRILGVPESDPLPKPNQMFAKLATSDVVQGSREKGSDIRDLLRSLSDQAVLESLKDTSKVSDQ